MRVFDPDRSEFFTHPSYQRKDGAGCTACTGPYSISTVPGRRRFLMCCQRPSAPGRPDGLCWQHGRKLDAGGKVTRFSEETSQRRLEASR